MFRHFQIVRILKEKQMFDQVKDLLVSDFKVPPSQVTTTATLVDLELDSLDVVELAEAVDNKLGAKISDDEMFELGTVGDIVRLIESRVRQADD